MDISDINETSTNNKPKISLLIWKWKQMFTQHAGMIERSGRNRKIKDFTKQ